MATADDLLKKRHGFNANEVSRPLSGTQRAAAETAVDVRGAVPANVEAPSQPRDVSAIGRILDPVGTVTKGVMALDERAREIQGKPPRGSESVERVAQGGVRGGPNPNPEPAMLPADDSLGPERPLTQAGQQRLGGADTMDPTGPQRVAKQYGDTTIYADKPADGGPIAYSNVAEGPAAGESALTVVPAYRGTPDQEARVRSEVLGSAEDRVAAAGGDVKAAARTYMTPSERAAADYREREAKLQRLADLRPSFQQSLGNYLATRDRVGYARRELRDMREDRLAAQTAYDQSREALESQAETIQDAEGRFFRSYGAKAVPVRGVTGEQIQGQPKRSDTEPENVQEARYIAELMGDKDSLEFQRIGYQMVQNRATKPPREMYLEVLSIADKQEYQRSDREKFTDQTMTTLYGKDWQRIIGPQMETGGRGAPGPIPYAEYAQSGMGPELAEGERIVDSRTDTVYVRQGDKLVPEGKQ